MKSGPVLRILIAAGVPRQREGGAAAIIYQLAERYREWGHAVDCLFLEDMGSYENVPTRFTDSAYALRLSRYIRQNARKYSVVNLHAPWGFAYALRKRILKSELLPPYVMTLQGAEERFSHAMRREAAKGRAPYFRWKNRLWHRAYHQQMYRQAIRGADQAIVANREAFAYLQLHHGMDAEKVWFVPNGVDESFFVPREKTTNGTRLLFVGTWLERKGIHYLRDAFVRLSERNPALRLTVAGCLTEETTVKSWFPTDLQERIEVRPLIAAKDMPEVYAAHDVFVFPSLMEGMPLSLIEAMASAMAVVTTDTCGMSDVVEDGYNGLLVKPACVEPLVEAVERVINSAELRTQLGNCARGSMQRYTWDLIARKYFSVLELAAEGRTA